MNKFEKRSRVSYDRMAPKYDSTFDGRFTLKFKKLLADKLVISEDTVLADVACGNGRLLKMLSDKGLKHGYGTDISPEMTAQAKTLNPDMIFYACGCDQLPLKICLSTL